MATFERFPNKRQVEEMAAELEAVSPELRISGVTYRSTDFRCLNVETTFWERGNRGVARELEKLGWRKSQRFRPGGWTSGNGYQITMRKAVPDEV